MIRSIEIYNEMQNKKAEQIAELRKIQEQKKQQKIDDIINFIIISTLVIIISVLLINNTKNIGIIIYSALTIGIAIIADIDYIIYKIKEK